MKMDQIDITETDESYFTVPILNGKILTGSSVYACSK